MTGYLDNESCEHWVCWRAEGCDSTDRPLDAPARLRTRQVHRFDAAVITPKRAAWARGATERTPLRTSSPAEGPAAPPQLSHTKRWRPSAITSIVRGVTAVLVVAALAAVVIVGWQAYADHAPHSVYSYTLCRDRWISHSQGPGTCSSHNGVAQYVYVEVTAPPAGWSSAK
jgi:hypothetical protein